MKPLQNEIEVLEFIQSEYPGVVIDLTKDAVINFINKMKPADRISYTIALHDEEYSPVGEWTRNASWYEAEGQDFGWKFMSYSKEEIRDVLINDILEFTEDAIEKGITKLHVSESEYENIKSHILTIPSRLTGKEYTIRIEIV